MTEKKDFVAFYEERHGVWPALKGEEIHRVMERLCNTAADYLIHITEQLMPTENEIEKEIRDKGLTAPRVTPADIEAAIDAEYYFTADDAVDAEFKSYSGRDVLSPLPVSLSTLTFCVLVLDNGYTVTGQSACADPANFDAEIGRKVARQKAVDQIWPLLGFRLRDKLVGN